MPSRHARSRRTWALRRHGAAAAISAAALSSLGLLLDVTGPTWAAATDPRAGAGAMLAGLAAVVAWVVVVRLLVTALAVALAALPGALGDLGRTVATTWSPAVTRGLVRAALGAAVASGPLAAQTAQAAWGDQAIYPTLDRVNSAPAAASISAPARPDSPSPGSVAGGAGAGAGHVVVVRPGDTLWGIAAENLGRGQSPSQVARAWPEWYEANRSIIGPDPDRIAVGLRLRPPAPQS